MSQNWRYFQLHKSGDQNLKKKNQNKIVIRIPYTFLSQEEVTESGFGIQHTRAMRK